jgi:3-deoxy-D-manno-octulosonic acid kinase
MRVIDAQLQRLPAGSILYDAARIRKPAAELFAPAHWRALGAVREVTGGRGAVSFIRPGSQSLQADDAWVLRHYRRGGLIAALSRDRYVWTGAERTRCFREWRLLAWLCEQGLPVPEPVAARYVRTGWSYRADLITVQLPASQTLAESIRRNPLSAQQWQRIGATIAAFHARGVHHADLNAHNILLGAEAVYVLDFDRGRIRQRGVWEGQVLARLQRSLEKVRAANAGVQFNDSAWQELLTGYADAVSK